MSAHPLKPRRILAFCLFFLALPLAQAAQLAASPRLIVHLLDYLAKDYSGAVSDGKILSESEYHEQLEFSRTAIEASRGSPELKNETAIQEGVAKLGKMIEDKRDAKEVARLARSLQAQVIHVSHLELSPKSWPNLARGSALFAQNCVSCHGAQGRGDGPAALALTPHPTNFRDEEVMKGLSPFQAFNTVRIGVPGTAMAPFTALSDEETWDLAFYAISLRHQGQAGAPDLKLLAKVASHSDEDLRKEHSPQALAALRLASGPGGGEPPTSSLTFAHRALDRSLDEYAKGTKALAGELALQAYLEGVEPAEARLRAKSNELTVELESRMGEVRSAIQKGEELPALQARVAAAHGVLRRSEAVLAEASAGSSQFVLFSVIAIFLREGFEALLIVLAVLSVIRASGAKRASRWVHGGWIAAIALGIVAWFASGWVMNISGAQRELMEALISLFAVFVLLYMGFWLHRQTEIGRWRQFIDVRIKTALDGRNRISLSLIAFFAVFREVFETVLFLRAIALEGGPDSGNMILGGVVIAFVLVLVSGWALLKTSAKLPIRKLFTVSSAVMIILAFMLTGKGLHSLQESGNLGETAWPFVHRMDFFGLYPTAETSLPQLVVLALGIVLWHYGKRPQRKTA